uniref:Uncharacterized protein n=1 Tax=Arundo donax TaxID=35708 RepID=A0A0A8YRR4_ARUDO
MTNSYNLTKQKGRGRERINKKLASSHRCIDQPVAGSSAATARGPRRRRRRRRASSGRRRSSWRSCRRRS